MTWLRHLECDQIHRRRAVPLASRAPIRFGMAPRIRFHGGSRGPSRGRMAGGAERLRGGWDRGRHRSHRRQGVPRLPLRMSNAVDKPGMPRREAWRPKLGPLRVGRRSLDAVPRSIGASSFRSPRRSFHERQRDRLADRESELPSEHFRSQRHGATSPPVRGGRIQDGRPPSLDDSRGENLDCGSAARDLPRDLFTRTQAMFELSVSTSEAR